MDLAGEKQEKSQHTVIYCMMLRSVAFM